MKKIITLILFLIACNAFSEPIDTEKYDRIIHSMLSDLSEVIANGNKTKSVEDVYAVAKGRIESEDVRFAIDPSKKTILGGMSFDFRKDSDRIDLSYGMKFLDTYKKGSSIHLSVLMHELRHLYDYASNRDLFRASKDDAKEEYWYELDAMHVEAEFIKNYLSGYDLSLFEQFLASSFDQDNLDSISVFMKKERMSTFFYFNSLETRYFDRKEPRDRLFDEIVANGKSWMDYYGQIDRNDRYTYFSCFITIGSYQKFMMPTIAALMENPTMTWNDVYKEYPEIENLYNALRGIIDEDNDIQMRYLQETYDYWEEDFMKKIEAQAT